MCTVTFFPQGDKEYTLTSNRDVAPNRHANELLSQKINGQKVVYPKDPKAGGTWIAIGENGKMVCLLNGGFIKHKVTPPYKKSRGLMVLESFEWDSFDAFAKEYNFENIEPFTLIGLNPNEGYFEFRWTGEMRFLRKLCDNTPVIWSSSTLYNREIRAVRKTWFNQWLKNKPSPSPKDIEDFHLNGGEHDLTNGFVMNRADIVCTTSISQVIHTSLRTEILHTDLISKKTSELEILNKPNAQTNR